VSHVKQETKDVSKLPPNLLRSLPPVMVEASFLGASSLLDDW